jgi:hypothetical protein
MSKEEELRKEAAMLARSYRHAGEHWTKKLEEG